MERLSLERRRNLKKDYHRWTSKAPINMDIPDQLLNEIKEMYADGGDDIYMQLCPHWDGEDDLFNVKSADDCTNLKNLKKVTLLYGDDQSILQSFKDKGVHAEWL